MLIAAASWLRAAPRGASTKVSAEDRLAPERLVHALRPALGHVLQGQHEHRSRVADRGAELVTRLDHLAEGHQRRRVQLVMPSGPVHTVM